LEKRVSMKFFKQFSRLNSIQDNLQTISSVSAKVAPPSFFTSVGRKFTLWNSKVNQERKLDVELVSYTDQKGHSEITSLIVEGRLVRLSQAREMVKEPQYRDSNLAVIVASLNLGTNLRQKDKSGLKIGSKLYRDDRGNVFYNKSDARTPGAIPTATIKQDYSYVQEAVTLLRDIDRQISLDDMKVDTESFKERVGLIRTLIGQMKVVDNLPSAHKTAEILGLQKHIMAKANGFANILNEVISLDDQVAANINMAVDHLRFLDTESSKGAQDKLGIIIESLSRAASGPDLSSLDKLFADSGLVGSDHQEQINAYIKSRALANDNNVVKQGIISNLAILEQSFSLTERSTVAHIDNNLSLNLLDLSPQAFNERLVYVRQLMMQIGSIDHIDQSYKTSEVTDLMGSITGKAREVSSVLNEMIDLEQRADNNIDIDIEQFDFIDNDNLELLHTNIAEITERLRDGLEGPSMQAIEDLLSSSITLSEDSKSAMSGYIKDKISDKDRAPVINHIVNSLGALEASLSLIQSNKATVKDIGEFLATYVHFQDDARELDASGNLSAQDLQILAKVNDKLAQNMEVLKLRYTDHLQDLDLEHNTSEGTNLRSEQEFLRGLTSVMPEFENARDIVGNLVHFAEQAGFRGEAQMSALSHDVKSKILQHYAVGTLSRPRNESLVEAVRRDKSQSLFYSQTLLQSLDKKLPHDRSGSKEIRGANVMLDPIFSGDYQMVAMACSSLKNPNDLTNALLDDYTLHLANSGSEIAHHGDEVSIDIAQRKNLLDHQIRVAKRDLSSLVKVESLGSIKLSESLSAARVLGLEDKRPDLDLLFVYAALSEIKLDTLVELESSSDKSAQAERRVFARRVGVFVEGMSKSKLTFLDNPEFKKLGLNPKMVEQADIITAIARTGFSDFKSLNRSLQKLSLSAKKLSSDPLLRETLIQQFMASDIDLLSRELQSNTMTQLFDMGHMEKGQLSSILDSESLGDKQRGYYAESASAVPIERRSKEVRGTKIGRTLTRVVQRRDTVQVPNGGVIALRNVGDALAAIRDNHQILVSLLSDIGDVNILDVLRKEEKDLSPSMVLLKSHLAFEAKCLKRISGNIKSTSQITHMAILYGFDQAKVSNSGLEFGQYLEQLRTQPSEIKDHLIDKFKMPESAMLLLDIQIRKLGCLKPKDRMAEMLKWHDDVHISDKARDLKGRVDKQSAAIGGEHVFSGLAGVLAPMRAGDEFMIDKTGKVTVKNDHEFANLAQEVLTEGAVEVVGRVSAIESNSLKIVKEEKGYSVIFNHALGLEFGLGISTAMGLAESSASVGGSSNRGYKVTFGNSEDQQKELSHFIRTVFYEPGLKVDDLARAESVYLAKGSEVKASAEVSFGLPSVLNSIAVGTGIMPGHQEVEAHKEEHLGTLSGAYRVGQAAGVSKRVVREVKRGEQVVTQSFARTLDFSGISGMEEVLTRMGVSASSLHSKYCATTKTAEKYGMITEHVITTEMTIQSDSDGLTQSDRSLLALSGLLKGSYEHDICMNDEEFKRGFEEKLSLYEEKSPIIIVERKIRQDALEKLTVKSQEFMHEYGKEEAVVKIRSLTEKTLNNPNNTEISRILIRSEQSQLRQETFKTTEVKAQTSEEIDVNRRALEEGHTQRVSHEHVDALATKSQALKAGRVEEGGVAK